MTPNDKRFLAAQQTKHLDTVIRRGRKPNDRFLFKSDYTLYESHCLVKRSVPFVPVLHGPQIPRRGREDTKERYARAILALFAPWRTPTDLCSVNETWSEALEARKHLFSPRSQQVIESIQNLHECKEERDNHLKQIIEAGQLDNPDNIDPKFIPEREEIEEIDLDELNDALVGLNESEESALLGGRLVGDEGSLQRTFNVFVGHGRFSYTDGEILGLFQFMF